MNRGQNNNYNRGRNNNVDNRYQNRNNSNNNRYHSNNNDRSNQNNNNNHRNFNNNYNNHQNNNNPNGHHSNNYNNQQSHNNHYGHQSNNNQNNHQSNNRNYNNHQNNNNHYDRNYHSDNHRDNRDTDSNSSKPIMYHGIPMYEDKRKIANDTLEFIRAGKYTVNRTTISIQKDISQCVNLTKVYLNKEEIDISGIKSNSVLCKFDITVESTLEAAKKMIEMGINDVAVLNFASATKPGGGWINGRDAQEETITRQSALYLSISSREPKEKFYKLHEDLLKSDDPEKNLYTNTIIYSPKVPVIRDSNKEELLLRPFLVSFITSPATNLKLLIDDFQKSEKGSKLPNIYKDDKKSRYDNPNQSQSLPPGNQEISKPPQLVGLGRDQTSYRQQYDGFSKANPNQNPPGNYQYNNPSQPSNNLYRSQISNPMQNNWQKSNYNPQQRGYGQAGNNIQPPPGNNYQQPLGNLYQQTQGNYPNNLPIGYSNQPSYRTPLPPPNNQGINNNQNSQFKPSFPENRNDGSNPRASFNSKPGNAQNLQNPNNMYQSRYDHSPSPATNQPPSTYQNYPSNMTRQNPQQPPENQKYGKGGKTDEISALKEKNRAVMHKRCEKIIKICIANKNKALILGAFGCGIFGNNPSEIADIFYDILVTKKLGNYLDCVVFALKGAKLDGYTFTSFKNKFLDGH